MAQPRTNCMSTLNQRDTVRIKMDVGGDVGIDEEILLAGFCFLCSVEDVGVTDVGGKQTQRS